MTNGNGSAVSWKWVAVTLVGIVVMVVGGIVADTRSCVSETGKKIEALQREKVDKEQYHRDIGEIKDSLRDIRQYIEQKG